MTTWLWEKTADGTARFVLGTEGENPLVCFGINPSTAVPNNLDPTVTRVSKFASRTPGQFDSWVMFNVYPQISTDPTGMHLALDPDLKAENERHIAQLVDGRASTRVPLVVSISVSTNVPVKSFSLRDQQCAPSSAG